MNWIDPQQNLVGAVKQIQSILQGESGIPEPTTDIDRFTLMDFLNKSTLTGLLEEEAKDAYHHFRMQGFKRANGLPIMSVEDALIIWKKNRHQFAPKESTESDLIRIVKKVEQDEIRRSGKDQGIMAQVVGRRSSVIDEVF